MMSLSTVFRVVAFLAAIPMVLAAYFLSPLSTGGGFGPAFSVALASLSMLCLWFGIRGHMHRDRVVMLWGTVAGFVVGGLGTAVGMVGYMVLYPKSNIAPVLGIFITGPYSFAGGVVVGILAGLFITRRRTSP